MYIKEKIFDKCSMRYNIIIYLRHRHTIFLFKLSFLHVCTLFGGGERKQKNSPLNLN